MCISLIKSQMFLILKLDFPKNCPKFNIMHSALKRLSYFGGFFLVKRSFSNDCFWEDKAGEGKIKRNFVFDLSEYPEFFTSKLIWLNYQYFSVKLYVLLETIQRPTIITHSKKRNNSSWAIRKENVGILFSHNKG